MPTPGLSTQARRWTARRKRSGAVTLYFTERLEPKFSGGEVRGPSGARVDRGSSVSGNVMRTSVGGLGHGRYSVIWHALWVDTQPCDAKCGGSMAGKKSRFK
jgi:methionine-rich copper-binding protein CopC